MTVSKLSAAVICMEIFYIVLNVLSNGRTLRGFIAEVVYEEMKALKRLVERLAT